MKRWIPRCVIDFFKRYNNCLGWALIRWWNNPDSYLHIRITRMNKWRFVVWVHILWGPKNCPDYGRPCPYMMSFQPEEHYIKRIFPPAFFKGRVVAGDDDNRE